MIAFEDLSYLSQVRRLRKLAEKAIELYSISVARLEFIHHGENATFCIKAKNGSKFLLRIHRRDYHSTPAIQEELRWLTRLSRGGFVVPNPVPSRSGQVLEVVTTPELPFGRKVCIFKWIEGSFVNKSLREADMYEIGVLLAKLQKNTPATRHRHYWDANGLVGAVPKFGSTTHLKGISPAHQKTITRLKPKVLAKLKAYEKRFPQRMGLIHGDLHFGNIVRTKQGLSPIDFDDSGFGFYVYDLMVPYISAVSILGPKRKGELKKFKQALIAGYASLAPWDVHDDEIFDHLNAARRISMLGWLNTRSDNPRLKKYLRKAAARAAKYLSENY